MWLLWHIGLKSTDHSVSSQIKQMSNQVDYVYLFIV